MSSRVNATSITLNKEQNHPDFKLEPLSESPLIFREKLFSKVLDPRKEDPEDINNFRTVTIKCLYPSCS